MTSYPPILAISNELVPRKSPGHLTDQGILRVLRYQILLWSSELRHRVVW
jgi:hypothetical protein